MACQNCGHSIRIRKSLIRGKSDSAPDAADECPECGATLSKSDGKHQLRKNVDN